MLIKGRELQPMDVADTQLRQDFVDLCIRGTKEDPTLTIVCRGVTYHKLPYHMLIDGNKTVIDKLDNVYQEMLLDIYGDISEEMYEEYLWMDQSDKVFLTSEKVECCFYQGAVFREA